MTSTDLLAEAMLRLAVTGSDRKTLYNGELNALAKNKASSAVRPAFGT